MSKTPVLVDPNDPHRILTQSEQFLENLEYNVYTPLGVKKGADPKMLQDAMEMIYKWYPTISKKATEPVNGVSRFTEGKAKWPDFLGDLKNNKVIRSEQDFHELMTEEYDISYDNNPYCYVPKLFKVDIKDSSNDKRLYLNSTHGYMLYTQSHHLIFDGKGHFALTKVINNFANDHKYVPNIERPQEMPYNIGALVPKDVKYVDLKMKPEPRSTTLFTSQASKYYKHKRGITFESRILQKDELRNIPGTSFNGGTSAVQAFIFNSLLLDYHTDKEKVIQAYGNPYAVDRSKFNKLMEGDDSLLVGNDIIASRIVATTDRESYGTLRDFIEYFKKEAAFVKKNKDQLAYNNVFDPYPQRLGPYFFPGGSRWSNFGKAGFEAGAIDRYISFGILFCDTGVVNFVSCGQPDGTILLTAMSHKISFSREFIQAYMDLFLRVYHIAYTRNLTREELQQLPEYKRVLQEL